MKIGFYDSGLGGIKTLKDIIDMGLKGEIYYLADEENRPYGTKSIQEVKNIAEANTKTLIDLGCKIIVIACNTATSVAINYLREKFPDVIIIGTEPAIKLAVKEELNKKILLLATTITVHGEKLNELVKKLNASNKIEFLATDKLVTLIEDENFLNNQTEIDKYLENSLKKYNLDEFSHIVLGCTHFPLVKKNIEEIVKGKNITVIDGNEGIGRNLLNKIGDNQDLLSLNIMSTAYNMAFEKRVSEILEDYEYDLYTFCKY